MPDLAGSISEAIEQFPFRGWLRLFSAREGTFGADWFGRGKKQDILDEGRKPWGRNE